MHTTVNSIFHFSYFDTDYPISRLFVTGLAGAYSSNILISVFVPELQVSKIQAFSGKPCTDKDGDYY
jgi:hypothetical protein